jgi:hypothetical protein
MAARIVLEHLQSSACSSRKDSAVILSTLAGADALDFTRDLEPVAALGSSPWCAVKASEMCLMQLPGGAYRVLFEGCDGTAKDLRGIWRGATAPSEHGAAADVMVTHGFDSL